MRKIDKVDFKYKSQLSYEPDDVNISLQHFRVSDLIQMIAKEALDILSDEDLELFSLKDFDDEDDDELDIYGEDELQRFGNLWTTIQKSRFIESLMIKLPIPLFYFDSTSKPWRVIDGLQRLHAIIGYMKNDYKLTSLEYLGKECEGKYFNSPDLPGYLKARILNSELFAYIVNPGTPEDVKYNIFKRINTGGLKLNGQEIRNAIFRGIPAKFTKNIVNEEIFIQATNGKVPKRRMMDREYANRFIAFQIFNYSDYNGKMDLFLSEAMLDLYNRTTDELKELNLIFIASMERAHQLFGGYAFYRPKENGQWGRQPNKALFDTLSWNLAELNEDEFSFIINLKIEFISKYFLFMNKNEEMFKAINDTTGSKTSVTNRFSLLQKFIKEFIHD